MAGLEQLSLDLMKLSSTRLKEFREENQRIKKKIDLNRQIYFVNIIENVVGILFQSYASDTNIECIF